MSGLTDKERRHLLGWLCSEADPIMRGYRKGHPANGVDVPALVDAIDKDDRLINEWRRYWHQRPEHAP